MVAPPLGAPGAGPLRLPGQCLRAGEPVLGARKGAGTALGAPGVMALAFSPVGPPQSPCPTRGVYTQTHTHVHLAGKDTCSAARACPHACLCTLSHVHTRVHLLALASQALPSSNLNVGEPGCPGRRVSPGRPDQGPSLSFPAWQAGGNGRRASWDRQGGSLSPGRPGCLCTVGAQVPSSLPAAPVLPASLEGSGPHTVGEG